MGKRIEKLGSLLILLLIGCKSAKYRKEFFPDSKSIKSEGYYINDRPVGIIKYYSTDGSLESTEEFDSSGALNGQSISYYKNGIPSEIVTYKNGEETGKCVSFRKDGTKKIVGILLNGKPCGDTYYFDSIDRLQVYTFLDFGGRKRMACRYDSAGKISEGGDHDYFIYDSLKVSKGINNVDTFRTMMLISHQPGTSMTIRIENVASGGQVLNSIKVDPIMRMSLYDNIIDQKADSIRMIADRYDSLSGMSTKFTLIRVTKDFR